MSKHRIKIALAGIVLLGLVLRLFALVFEPPHHPDEFFQYLEPAWKRLTGAGVETWEWRRGIRSWVLPGYHGAWMALLMRFGIHDGVKIATFLRLHWALLSLVLVWAGWRGGALLARRLEPAPEGISNDKDTAPAGWQGGLVGALLCAAFPLLVRFSIHTFSELASILCMVPAMVLTAELSEGRANRGKAVWMGVLLGLGLCLRIQHAAIPLVAVLWLLLARRFMLALVACAAALLPVLAFAGVDWLTWGSFFSSYIGYLKFNIFEGGAATFGTSPLGWYWHQFLSRLPLGLPILGILCVLGFRTVWPFVSAAVGLVLLLSTQQHKEERFVMLFWPLVLIAAAGSIGAWLGPRPSVAPTPAQAANRPARFHRRHHWLVRVAMLVSIAIVLGDGALHCRGNDFAELFPARFAAQAWVGRQDDVTGLLYDEPLYVGGYLWFGRTFPQLQFDPILLGNPLFSHVLVPRNSASMHVAERAGFVPVFTQDAFVVLRRNADGPRP